VKDSLWLRVGTVLAEKSVVRLPSEQGCLQGGGSLPTGQLEWAEYGVALTSCTVPAKGTPTFKLGDREMEMGIGIHGEPGRSAWLQSGR